MIAKTRKTAVGGRIALLAVLVLQLPLIALSAVTPAPQARVVEAVNESQRVKLAGSTPSFVTNATDNGAAPATQQIHNVALVLKRSTQQEQALAHLLAEQQNSQSSDYHRWLRPAEFGARFGIAEQDIAKLVAWLQANGFSVDSVANGRNVISFSGTQAQLRAAFHTELHSYTYQGKKYWANNADPELPAAFAPIVAGVRSLNSFAPKAARTDAIKVRHNGSGVWAPVDSKSNLRTNSLRNIPRPQLETTSGFHVVTPYDFATMYNVKPLWDANFDGTGQTIAIVSDSDMDPADVDYFRSTFGLPEKKLHITYAGDNPGMNEDEGEAALDVQWAGATAPGVSIELVVAPTTDVSSGVDDAALYIVNNDLAPIMNVSYGQCEMRMGSGYNAFYNEIWKQAAAQGITVVVAAGDAGSAGCDQGSSTALYGLGVNGLGSTPYNVSIGGTDFYDSYVAPNNYWSSSNNPTTLQSLFKRIPETPWNNSCGNPLVLDDLRNNNGANDDTAEQLCNDPNWMWSYMTTVGGGGGLSSCAHFADDGKTCVSGYDKPDWQNNIPGLEQHTVRSLPDISLFAGNGLWNSAYVYCQGDAMDSGSCDIHTGIQAAGGTSFGAPAFAGVLALVAQKTGGRIGNPNYILYKLAGQQYADSSMGSACTSDNTANGDACIFYDVVRGGNAMPCIGGMTNCTPGNPDYSYGVLPGYPSVVGYDYASGLGSINAANLVNAWTTATTSMLPTRTEISANGPVKLGYGDQLKVAVTVSADSGTPTGDVAFESDSTTPGNVAVGSAGALADGHLETGVGGLPVGSFNVYARYAGNASYATSKSSGVAISVTKASTTGAVTANAASVTYDDSLSLQVTLLTVGVGLPPSGTVTIVNSTTGITVGTAGLAQSATGSTASFSSLARKLLAAGDNTIVAIYEGDVNYNSLTASAAVVHYDGPFALNLGASHIDVTNNVPVPVELTLTPSGTASIDLSTLKFSCPTTASLGVVCQFSQPVKNADRTVYSAVSVSLTSPLVGESAKQAAGTARRLSIAGGWSMTLMGAILLPLARRRRRMLIASLSLLLLTGAFMAGGCGSSSQPTATIGLAASADSVQYGESVTLTAAVQSTGKVPVGSVDFYDGGTKIGSATLNGGSGILKTTSLTVGTHSITSLYVGNTKVHSALSGAVTVRVGYTATIPVVVTDASLNTSSASLTVNFQ